MTYGMRFCAGSSDVCSSDLTLDDAPVVVAIGDTARRRPDTDELPAVTGERPEAEAHDPGAGVQHEHIQWDRNVEALVETAFAEFLRRHVGQREEAADTDAALEPPGDLERGASVAGQIAADANTGRQVDRKSDV